MPSTRGQQAYFIDISEIFAKDGSILLAWTLEYSVQNMEMINGDGKEKKIITQTSILLRFKNSVYSKALSVHDVLLQRRVYQHKIGDYANGHPRESS